MITIERISHFNGDWKNQTRIRAMHHWKIAFIWYYNCLTIGVISKTKLQMIDAKTLSFHRPLNQMNFLCCHGKYCMFTWFSVFTLSLIHTVCGCIFTKKYLQHFCKNTLFYSPLLDVATIEANVFFIYWTILVGWFFFPKLMTFCSMFDWLFPMYIQYNTKSW